jgi:ribonuclease-3
MASSPSVGDQSAAWPDDRLSRAATALEIEFRNPELLRLALTHRSYLNELATAQAEVVDVSNERLEFLGDSVLGMITAEFLFERFPRFPEGTLTAYRTALVRTETLAHWARQFGLDEFLYLGRGEVSTDGEVRDRILAGAFEAIIAAIYLDRGMRAACRFLHGLLGADAEEIISLGQETNYKGRLQELIQERERITPMYRTIAVSGPAHNRTFTIEAVVNGEGLGLGHGSSKRAAQQEAARQALVRLAAEGVTEDDERSVR